MFNRSTATLAPAGNNGQHVSVTLPNPAAAPSQNQLPTPPQGPSPSQSVKIEVHRRLLENMDLAQARRMPREELQRECMRRIDLLLGDMRTPLSSPEKQRLLRELMDEVFGLGPIEELLRDPMVTDILVNGPNQMYVERMGRLEPVDHVFRD